MRLTGWATPALLVPGDAALAALGALADPDPDGPWAAGASLRYLCVLAGHACDLARRGRMLPQLVTEARRAGGALAPGADRRGRGDLPRLRRRDAAGLPGPPPMAVPPGTAGPPLRIPRPLRSRAPARRTPPLRSAVRVTLRSALEALVDAAARAVMPERLLLGHRPGPKAPLPDRWVLALTADDPTLPGAEPGRGRRAAARARRLDARGQRRARPDPGELPADRAAAGRGRLGAGVRAAVRRGPQPLPAAPPICGRAAGCPACRSGRTRRCWPGWAARSGCSRCCTWRCCDPEPAAMTLDTGEAHEFLRQAAPLLQAAGFGVQLPNWAGRKAVGLKLTTRSRTQEGRVPGGRRLRVRPGPAGRLPDRPGDRRRRGHRRGAGRAGPAQGAAGPGARPVGRAGRPAAQGRAQGGRPAPRRAS